MKAGVYAAVLRLKRHPIRHSIPVMGFSNAYTFDFEAREKRARFTEPLIVLHSRVALPNTPHTLNTTAAFDTRAL